jgi:hypothetical protein
VAGEFDTVPPLGVTFNQIDEPTFDTAFFDANLAARLPPIPPNSARRLTPRFVDRSPGLISESATFGAPALIRITFAEVAYQASSVVTISCGVGNAVANGSSATVGANLLIAGTVGNAVANGSTATVGANVVLPATVGNAVANGSTAAVSQFGVQVTWAQAQYEAAPTVTIPFTVGNAVAAGATASVTLYGAVRVTWAQAQYEASAGGATVPCTVGDAVASGPAGATVSVDTDIFADVGNAVAAGPDGATVSVDQSVDADVGNAVAAGLVASVSSTSGPSYLAQVTWAQVGYETDPNVTIYCGVGNAIAAGLQCRVLPPLAQSGATPGYAPKSRYRVRVGKRWMEVDPLDPMSVRRAYDAAQEDAQDAAEQDVQAPAAVAAQAVVVQPMKGPDYAGLARDAKRISEDIRKVYADALQTALIARLMREQIERDDEDDIAVLLASI